MTLQNLALRRMNASLESATGRNGSAMAERQLGPFTVCQEIESAHFVEVGATKGVTAAYSCKCELKILAAI